MKNVVGPLLRGLWAEGDMLGLVRCGPATAAERGVRLGPDAAPAAVLEALRGRPSIDMMQIEGIGTFERRNLKARPGRLSGRVAVVTGGAQGFGLGIGEGLAAEGAWVVLADRNLPMAREAAQSIPGAVAARVDVGYAHSVERLVSSVVSRYGGVDLLVSNAGILRAGSVLEQSPAEFEAVTRVNYLGYYHCVHAFAPVMALQHLACPDARADIVQINSKSGLEGSKRNAAYSGAKFGGIGLTQSFALELIEHGIKVNAICPGNYLEGPLWSDPNEGLFAQYLRSGKVEGAKTIEDVRRAYEQKVPMGRGCHVQDVVRAVLYTVEQKYETGQAIPVTGGQVMLP